MPAKAGVWGGRTAAERHAERRQRLIDAATEIWVDSGWAAVTMRGVCARTSLNDRYFYDHFADRDELLATVWDGMKDDLMAKLVTVLTEDSGRPPIETLSKGIAVVVERIAADPGWAQIMFGHHVGSAVLEQRRTAVLHQATDIMVGVAKPFLKPDADVLGLRMDALVGIGGFVELMTAWQSGLLDVDAPDVIDHCSRLGATLAAAYLDTSRAD
ncbi:TetR/AcrR family transcriptional regulator [Mycolicibacterium sp.]|uniref:TetR/AcrR family transcriptional regulator n=1 Tax=Mycolicibacterium sp. TaxID=2320850 RepID=UPI0028A76D26|nr:TetR/AcrR family transcriptional regulator [Mycolicibacterium sp.]